MSQTESEIVELTRDVSAVALVTYSVLMKRFRPPARPS